MRRARSHIHGREMKHGTPDRENCLNYRRGRGIGQAAARQFADEGARVVLVDLDEAALQSAVQSIGEDMASYAVADVTQPEQVQSYVNAAVERWGGIDIFLANAGIEGTLSPIPDYPVDIFDQVMAVNVRGVWLGLKYVIPVMRNRDGGSIVITSSTAGIGGSAGMSGVCRQQACGHRPNAHCRVGVRPAGYSGQHRQSRPN